MNLNGYEKDTVIHALEMSVREQQYGLAQTTPTSDLYKSLKATLQATQGVLDKVSRIFKENN
jgi:hypothetical protein